MRGRDQKAQQSLQVQRMRRAADRELRRRVRAEPIARGVAQRAIEGDALVAEPLDRQSDRQPFSLLPGEPERAVAAISGLLRSVAGGGVAFDQVGKHPRQDHEDRIGDSGHQLAAERAVMESRPRVGQLLRRAGEEFPPDDKPRDRGGHDSDNRQGGEPDRESSAAPAAAIGIDACAAHQNVFRYSTIASLSAAGSSVP